MAITPFKVTEGHHFGINLKPVFELL